VRSDALHWRWIYFCFEFTTSSFGFVLFFIRYGLSHCMCIRTIVYTGCSAVGFGIRACEWLGLGRVEYGAREAGLL